MNDAPPGRAAIYCRISRDAEGEKVGVERQKKLCLSLAERHGLEVAEEHIYTDNDIGASEKTGAKKKGKRKEYFRMLSAARAGEFSTIISYSITRLTRRVREFEDLITLHEETGVSFVLEDQNSSLDLTTPQGLFMARMMANVATFESDVISQRQKAAFRDNAMLGKPKKQNGRPFGWNEDWNTLNPEEAELIRDAIRKIKAGSSIEAIRRSWEDMGVLTPKGNRSWPHSTLKRMLTTWRMVGVSTYHGQPLKDANGNYIRGNWTPIITLEDRDKALAMLEKRALTGRREGQRRWMLTGLVRCAECGGTLYGKIGTGKDMRDTYSCSDGRGHNAIQADRLEEYVERALADRLLKKLLAGEPEPPGEDQEPEAWPGQERLTSVQEKIDELLEAYREDRLTGEVVFDEVAKLEAEKKELNRQRDAHYAAQAKPEPAFQRTKDLLEWAQDLSIGAPYRRRESRDLPEWMNQPWGTESRNAGTAEDTDPLAEEKMLTLRRELKHAVIKKGKRGGGSWKDEVFYARIELVWND